MLDSFFGGDPLQEANESTFVPSKGAINEKQKERYSSSVEREEDSMDLISSVSAPLREKKITAPKIFVSSL